MDLRVVVLTVIVLASWPTASAAPVETSDSCIPVRTRSPLPPIASVADLRERAPIVIRGDAMLKLGPAAGVCGGRGTAQDPYRIERWYIDGANWTLNGGRLIDAAIEISGTTAHVLVQNVTIEHAPPSGILVRAAENVRIENIHVTDAAWIGFEPSFGVAVVDSRNVRVADSTFLNERSSARDFTAVTVRNSTDVTVEGNRFVQITPPQTRFFGVHAGNSTGTRILGNTFDAASVSGRFYGIHLTNEVSPVVRKNTVLGSTSGRGTCLTMRGATTPDVSGNAFGLCANAFLVADATGGTIFRNVVHNATIGIVLDSSAGVTLGGNRVDDTVRPFNVTGGKVADFYHTIAPNNTVDGVAIQYLTRLRNAVVDVSGASVVYVVGARDSDVRGAAPRGQSVGMTVVDSVRTTFHDLDLRGNDLGLRVLASSGLRVDRVLASGVRVESGYDVRISNLTSRAAYVGLFFGATDASRVERSLFEENVHGIRVHGGNTVTVASSVVRSNAVGGIHLVQPDFVRVVDGDIASNGVFGVRHDGVTGGGSRSDLRNNWWGHVGGPTVGTTFAGDKLVHGNSAKVTYSPWLSAPAVGAGPAGP